jgi:DNA-binding NarL/FixJ family response regulator
MKPRTLIAHDHRLFMSGLERMLAAEFEIVGTVDELQSLPDAVLRFRPDVVLQCLSATPSVGLDIISHLHHSMPDTRIVVVTRWADGALAADALRRGASAYIHQSATEKELLNGVRAAVSRRPYVSPQLTSAMLDSLAQTGESTLTRRQVDVVRLLAQGKSMKEAADVLRMSPRTVAFHKYGVMRKLHMTNTAELVRFALNQRLL